MNIYTVTYIQKNYGSLLQAYALQNRLKSFGATAYILVKQQKEHSYIYKKLSALWSVIVFLIKPNRDYSFYKKLQLKVGDLKFKSKYRKLDIFIENNLSILKIKDENEFLDGCEESDVFLAGSDQIWNTLKGPLSPWYSFQWVKNIKFKKFSYAASIGQDSLTDIQIKLYSKGLSSFDCISLREFSAFNLFRPLFNCKVRQDLDPTLLYDNDFWDRITAPRLISEPYVFVYRLRPNENVFQIARKVAKEKKCKIVYTGSYAYKADDILTIYDAGVEEFLSYIKYAEAVVTNSFHGTAFSIIMQKPFLSVKIATTGSRAESLLRLLNLNSNLVDDISKTYNIEVDYKRVNELLNIEREESLDYIKSICTKK